MSENKNFKSVLESRAEENMNEETVCTRIIVPYIHNVLGWEMNSIHAEWKVSNYSDKTVDYCLGKKSDPNIIVEAKSISKNIERHTDQLKEYMKLSDTRYGVLTNGLDYLVLEYKDENIKTIDTYSITDLSPQYLQLNPKENNKKDSFTDTFIERYDSSDLSSDLILALLAQYQSSYNPLKPLHISLILDKKDSYKYREFLRKQYDDSLYFKVESNKTTLINSSSNPNLVILDALDSKSKIKPSLLKNSVSSTEIDKLSGLPKQKPLLVLSRTNTEKETSSLEDQSSISDTLLARMNLIYSCTKDSFENDKIESNRLNQSNINQKISIEEKPRINTDIKKSEELSNFVESIKPEIKKNSQSITPSEVHLNSVYLFARSLSNLFSQNNRSSVVEESQKIMELFLNKYSLKSGELKVQKFISVMGEAINSGCLKSTDNSEKKTYMIVHKNSANEALRIKIGPVYEEISQYIKRESPQTDILDNPKQYKQEFKKLDYAESSVSTHKLGRAVSIDTHYAENVIDGFERSQIL